MGGCCARRSPAEPLRLTPPGAAQAAAEVQPHTPYYDTGSKRYMDKDGRPVRRTESFDLDR